MKNVFITISGTNFKVGTDCFEREDKVLLKKDFENEHDTEAIEARVEGLGQIGWVANSVHTVREDCFSAGRIYDAIGESAVCTVKFVLPDCLVCQLDEESIIYPPVAWTKG